MVHKPENKTGSYFNSLFPAFNDISIKLAIFFSSTIQNATISDLGRKYNHGAEW